jgi:hypothetical protein
MGINGESKEIYRRNRKRANIAQNDDKMFSVRNTWGQVPLSYSSQKEGYIMLLYKNIHTGQIYTESEVKTMKAEDYIAYSPKSDETVVTEPIPIRHTDDYNNREIDDLSQYLEIDEFLDDLVLVPDEEEEEDEEVG